RVWTFGPEGIGIEVQSPSSVPSVLTAGSRATLETSRLFFPWHRVSHLVWNPARRNSDRRREEEAAEHRRQLDADLQAEEEEEERQARHREGADVERQAPATAADLAGMTPEQIHDVRLQEFLQAARSAPLGSAFIHVFPRDDSLDELPQEGEGAE